MEKEDKPSTWWAQLSADDRARIIVPFIQLSLHHKKPWKCEWDTVKFSELDRLFELVEEQKKIRKRMWK